MKNTKKVLGAMDCGCLILELEQIADLSPKYYKIEYCNKHKAAPDMYEALKNMLNIFNRGTMGNIGRQVCDDAIKAINKAEGI